MGFFSSLGNAFGSIGGALLQHNWDKDAAKKSWERSSYSQDKAFQHDIDMWNRQNEYNTPLAQMERYEAAGLNKNLIYSNGNPGNATSAPSMHMAEAPKANSNLNFDKMMPFFQMRNLESQNALINAQTVAAQADAENKGLLNIRYGIENEYLPARLQAEVDKIREETKNIPYSNPVKSAVKSADTFLSNWNPTVSYDNSVPAPLEMAYRKNLYKRWGKDAMKHYKAPVDRRPGDFK